VGRSKSVKAHESQMVRKIYGPMTREVTKEWRKLKCKKLLYLCSSSERFKEHAFVKMVIIWLPKQDTSWSAEIWLICNMNHSIFWDVLLCSAGKVNTFQWNISPPTS
jgi:hypothetical protein